MIVKIRHRFLVSGKLCKNHVRQEVVYDVINLINLKTASAIGLLARPIMRVLSSTALRPHWERISSGKRVTLMHTRHQIESDFRRC